VGRWQGYDLDSFQRFKISLRSAGGDHAHAHPQIARRQGGIGGRTAQPRAACEQVVGYVADDKIVHRLEGCKIKHNCIIPS